jgi:hypothetical protein
VPLSTKTSPQLTLYHRAGCHLCREMEEGLRRLQPDLGFQLTLVDIDGATALRDQYGTLVPLLMGEGGEVCRYFLDEAALRAASGLSPLP